MAERYAIFVFILIILISFNFHSVISSDQVSKSVHGPDIIAWCHPFAKIQLAKHCLMDQWFKNHFGLAKFRQLVRTLVFYEYTEPLENPVLCHQQVTWSWCRLLPLKLMSGKLCPTSNIFTPKPILWALISISLQKGFWMSGHNIGQIIISVYLESMCSKQFSTTKGSTLGSELCCTWKAQLTV